MQEFRDAGFSDVRISQETPYPSSFILDDPGVRDFVARNPDAKDDIRSFAESIVGAHLEASKHPA